MLEESKKLDGKVAIITGGASGIGAATAKLFAKQGATTMIMDINTDAGMSLQANLRALGCSAEFIHCDVSDEEQICKAVRSTLDAEGRIDILINNAGIGVADMAHETSLATWHKVMNLNLDATFLFAREVLGQMMAQGNGVIINISSIMGHVACSGASSYVASKHAVIGLTKSLALEYATHGIRVNAVCPGYVVTAMGRADLQADPGLIDLHPMKRFALPEEIAKAILFLASDDASFITGSSLAIDGGYLAQ